MYRNIVSDFKFAFLHGPHAIADRYEKRHKNLTVHVSPAFRVEQGDTVTVGEYGEL